jgi:hypothetical protein
VEGHGSGETRDAREEDGRRRSEVGGQRSEETRGSAGWLSPHANEMRKIGPRGDGTAHLGPIFLISFACGFIETALPVPLPLSIRVRFCQNRATGIWDPRKTEVGDRRSEMLQLVRSCSTSR